MNREHDKQHAEAIDSWIQLHPKNLTSSAIIKIFGDAIMAVRKRTLVTLSEVTVNAIIDRVQHETAQKFPMLNGMKIENATFLYEEETKDHDQEKAPQLIQAFRAFLIELIAVLGNLTAGILIKPIHLELDKMTAKAEPGTNKKRKDQP